MSTQKVIEFIVDYLNERGVILTTTDCVGFNYLENGAIDSFELLSLIMALDAEFEVKIELEDMLNSQSKTVDGLALLVAGKMC